MKPPFLYLWRCWCVFVAWQDLECNTPAAVPQQLLEHMWVAADLSTIHLSDYVPCVQHALPVNWASVQDPGYHHLSSHHAECHPLKESKSQ